MANPSAIPLSIKRYGPDKFSEELDVVAVEEPLEIRLGFGAENTREQKSLSITMRTPGHDFELVLGFLFTEGIIAGMDDVRHIEYCTDQFGEKCQNIVRVEIRPEIRLDWEQFQRHFYTNSSCGICGKASIESLEQMHLSESKSEVTIGAKSILGLIDKMREAQGVFEHTGGLHAAAIFDANGNLIYSREDIGRHNALDKVIGAALFKNLLPLDENLVMLSGRSCFELIQKSIAASIPIVVSVGAPSSLAVETATKFGISLIGFTKRQSFNIYSKSERII